MLGVEVPPVIAIFCCLSNLLKGISFKDSIRNVDISGNLFVASSYNLFVLLLFNEPTTSKTSYPVNCKIICCLNLVAAHISSAISILGKIDFKSL